MLRLIYLLAMTLISATAAARIPTANEFESHIVEDAALGPIKWHLDSVNAEKKGPLVIWLPGSGAMPYFQHYTDGSVGFTFPLALLEYRDQAHFLLVDKPGIPFAAQLKFDEKRGRPIEIDNAAYRAGLTKSHLTARAAIAIREARKLLGPRMGELIIIGGSEGAQYAFALAREVQADRVVGWGGIALPQYYDLIIEQRLAAERGEITRAEAQANVEQIYRQIKAIGKAPYDLSERFQGEAYRRWAGFGPYAAVDDMLALDVPLLLVQGGRDSNAPILNSDYAMLAFLMRGKVNLEYWVYPNSDHSFNSTDPANKSKTISIQKEVWDRVWKWIEKQ